MAGMGEFAQAVSNTYNMNLQIGTPPTPNETQSQEIKVGDAVEILKGSYAGTQCEVQEVFTGDDGRERVYLSKGHHRPYLASNVRPVQSSPAEALTQVELDQLHELALIEDVRRSLPEPGTFYQGKVNGGRRVEVVRTDALDGGWMRVASVDGDSVNWISLDELGQWYDRLGTKDEAHLEALHMEALEEDARRSLPQAGEFWVNRITGERVRVRRVARDRTRGLFLDDVHEGEEDLDLGWRYLPDFLFTHVRMHTMDEAHAEALALAPSEEAEMVVPMLGHPIIPNPDDTAAMWRLYDALGATSSLKVHCQARDWIQATVRVLYARQQNSN